LQHADACIAFLGLDVRVRDSGAWRGRRKLTKKGNPELRCLLFLTQERFSSATSTP
jgi:transposase